MQKISKMSLTGAHAAARRCIDRKQYKEAEHHILKILRKDINDHAGLALLAEWNAIQGRIKEAIPFYMSAIRENPVEQSYKEKFIELAGSHPVAQYEEITETAILECLKSADVLDCNSMRRLWLSHLRFRPDFEAAYGLRERKRFDPANKGFFESLTNFKPLFSPYFLLGIKAIAPTNVIFEEFITHIRKHLLGDFGLNRKFSAEEGVTLAAALSFYSFHTDYIFDCTEEELEKVAALRAEVEAGGQQNAIALLACYMPLHRLKNRGDIERRFSASPDLADVVKLQISDHIALQEAAARITAITSIDDEVSTKVREQYEEFPYPRWKSVSPANISSGWKRAGCNGQISAALQGKRAKILIAGCGTGREAIMFSIVFPDAEILAVDLSRASLAYATNKAEEYKIRNVTFRHADILRLDVLEQQFDLIVSGGVLHHMKDPMRGWRVLYDRLKPGGLMIIGLYSKYARAGVLQAREVIREKGYAPDVEGMRRFRRDSPRILDPQVHEGLYFYSDYFYMPAYRDLLFHVQEHNYDLLDIKNMLAEMKLSFVDFAIAMPPTPGDGSLESWHAFEQQNPRTFPGMYLFWCRKAA